MKPRAWMIGAAALAAAGPAAAMGKLLMYGDYEFTRCRIETFQPRYDATGHYYTGTGQCHVFAEHFSTTDPSNRSEFSQERLLYSRKFKVDGRHDPKTRRTSERITLPVEKPDQYKTAAVVQVVMQCAGDPWLDASIQACADVQLTTQGWVGDVKQALSRQQPRLPFTAEPNWDRAAFRAAYDRAQTIANLAGSRDAATSTSRIGATAGSTAGALTSPTGARTTLDRAGSTAGALTSPTGARTSPTGARTTLDRAGSTTTQVVGGAGSLMSGTALVIPSTAKAVPSVTAPVPAPTAPATPTAPAAAPPPSVTMAAVEAAAQALSPRAAAAAAIAASRPALRGGPRQGGPAQRQALNPQPLPPKMWNAPVPPRPDLAEPHMPRSAFDRQQPR
jgi:hypothetical protein